MARRSSEFAIRAALGATQGDFLRSVLQAGVFVALFGAIIGSAASVLLGRFIRSQLYDTSPTDPAILIAFPIVLAVVAILASLAPANAATRAAPATALKAE